MSVVIRLKVPIEMHYTVIPMGTSKVNSSLEDPKTKKLSASVSFVALIPSSVNARTLLAAPPSARHV